MPVARLGAVLMLLLLAVPALACSKYPQATLPVANLPVSSPGGQVLLRVELAQTENQRNCGLMGRPRLADGTGMLFDMRPAGPAHFWMENTPEPLDLIFMDAEGRVVFLVRNAVPYSTDSLGTSQPVAAVLELAAGEADRLGIGLGAQAKLPWTRR